MRVPLPRSIIAIVCSLQRIPRPAPLSSPGCSAVTGNIGKLSMEMDDATHHIAQKKKKTKNKASSGKASRRSEEEEWPATGSGKPLHWGPVLNRDPLQLTSSGSTSSRRWLSHFVCARRLLSASKEEMEEGMPRSRTRAALQLLLLFHCQFVGPKLEQLLQLLPPECSGCIASQSNRFGTHLPATCGGKSEQNWFVAVRVLIATPPSRSRVTVTPENLGHQWTPPHGALGAQGVLGALGTLPGHYEGTCANALKTHKFLMMIYWRFGIGKAIKLTRSSLPAGNCMNLAVAVAA